MSRDQRSIVSFVVLAVVAIATTLFLLGKTEEAVAGIEALQGGRAYLHAGMAGDRVDTPGEPIQTKVSASRMPIANPARSIL